jgi:coenzyme F420-0:L-glutamate ligase/coenzyme F420-1:gamma-L-glutamate ligase
VEHADIFVVTQKVVSKAEGRMLCLSDITPGPRAPEIAASSGKDARKVRAIWDESSEIVRVTRAGSESLHRSPSARLVCANAGIDESNVGRDQTLLLLPVDPDESARRLALAVKAQVGICPKWLLLTHLVGHDGVGS